MSRICILRLSVTQVRMRTGNAARSFEDISQVPKPGCECAVLVSVRKSRRQGDAHIKAGVGLLHEKSRE